MNEHSANASRLMLATPVAPETTHWSSVSPSRIYVLSLMACQYWRSISDKLVLYRRGRHVRLSGWERTIDAERMPQPNALQRGGVSPIRTSPAGNQNKCLVIDCFTRSRC